jgi:phage terminase small subunit
MADLTTKQRVFVERYLQNGFNATEAARYAGYSEKTAYSIGQENLKKPEIESIIQARLDQEAMSANEVLHRLAEHARATADDFLTIERVKRIRPPDNEGDQGEEYEVTIIRLDLVRASENGKLHLIKSLKDTKYGIAVDLHDSQSALALLGKHHKLFVDRIEHTGKDGEDLYASVAAALDQKLLGVVADSPTASVPEQPR